VVHTAKEGGSGGGRPNMCVRGHGAREKMGKDVFPDDARWENMFSQMRCFPR